MNIRTLNPWTEEALEREIARLDSLIEEAGRVGDRRSRCAAAYLRQVKRDRREVLATLRFQRRH